LALLARASLPVLAMAEPSDVSRTSFDHRAVQQAGADSVRQGTGPGKARVKRRTTQLGDGGEIALAAVAPPLRRHYPGSDDYQIAAAHRPVRHLSRLLRPTRSPRIGELRTSLSRKFRRIGGDTRMAGSYSPPVGWTGVNSTLLPGKDGPPIALPTALQRCTVMPHCVLLSVGDVVRLGGPALARSDLALGPGAGRGGDPARDTGRCGHVPFHLAARGRSAVPPARWRDNGGFTGSPGQAGMWGPRRARRSAERRAQSRGCCSGSVFTGLRGGHDQHAGAA
jgi:hypothetical protein